jgi:HAD superfamily hydrolase (TIGR01484 family)
MKQPPIQLLSTDFDGTLFAEFEQPPVPLALQELIGQLQTAGVTWVINTGRDMAALMECMGRAHLTVRPDYLVLVEREIYRRDHTRYIGLDDWNQACHEAHETLFRRVQRDLPEIVGWINGRFEATLYEDGYSPLCLIASNSEDADAIIDYLETYCRSVPDLTIVRNDVYARFSHTSFSKGTALAEIQRRLQLSPRQTAAAGDHFNDLTMLSAAVAHHLIAPANAVEPVQHLVRSQQGVVSPQSCGLGILDGLQQILQRTGPSCGTSTRRRRVR